MASPAISSSSLPERLTLGPLSYSFSQGRLLLVLGSQVQAGGLPWGSGAHLEDLVKSHLLEPGRDCSAASQTL